MSGPSVDEEGWAHARARLDRTAPEPADRQAARERYDRRAAGVASAVAGSALVLALLSLVLDPPPDAGEPPTWRVVTGSTVAVLGLCLFLLRPARPFGSPRGTTRPLEELSGPQREHLDEQVRGRVPAVPELLPLARLQAQALLEQRTAVWSQLGLGAAFVGFWVVDRSIWRTVLTLAIVAGAAAVVAVARRDERVARRFLDEHPA